MSLAKHPVRGLSRKVPKREKAFLDAFPGRMQAYRCAGRTAHPTTSIRGTSGIETGDRVDRQLTVGPLKSFEVGAVLAASGKALEADEAAQRGDAKGSAAPQAVDRIGGNRLVVEGRQPASHDVDHAVATVDSEMVGRGHVGGSQDLAVAEASGTDQLEKAKNRRVRLRPVGDEQIGI